MVSGADQLGAGKAWRYRRWRALSLMFLAGFAAIYLTRVLSLQPEGPRPYEQDLLLTWFARPSIICALVLCLVIAARFAYTLLTAAPDLSVTDEWIEARTFLGLRRRLTWSEINEIASCGSAFMLSRDRSNTDPAALAKVRFALRWLGGAFAFRRPIVIIAKVLDASPGEIEAVITKMRPDLVLRCIEE